MFLSFPKSPSDKLALRQRTKLIVGIDYGTTYSGLSFALSNAADFKDIIPWTKYPGASSHNAEHCVKAPSRVAFKDENSELDENAWGYQVEPGMRAYAWTKLLLDRLSLQSDYDDPDLYKPVGDEMIRLPQGKSAKDVATEYLKGMYNMFQGAVTDLFGGDKLDDLPIDFWLTVPATWSEKAKLLTKNAAMHAGFATRAIDRIMLISEPEAAAHLALKSSLHHLDNFVTPGTGVMVCDCGGGTVDLTTYEVTDTKPSLKLREIAVGVAGKCGGTFVDRNLFKLLAQRFGDAFTSLGPDQIGPASPFMDQFELRKKDFSLKNPSRRAQRIPLFMPQLQLTPALEKYYEKRSNSVLLTSADFKMLFDPVVDMILKLVGDQVAQVKKANESAVETLVLVGGFGSSPYLKERLSEWCEDANMRMTTPISGAWSAIVCGAVVRGLEGSIVKEKKCRRHYGHVLSEPYDPERHRNFDKKKRFIYKHSWFDREYLTGFMYWEIRKVSYSSGAVIDETTEISSSFQKTMTYGWLYATHRSSLYCCSLDEGPESIESDRIEKVGEVSYTLDKLDMGNVESKVDNDGVKQYRVSFQLNIRLDDESGHLVFRVLHGEKEIGKAAIDLAHS
ncbi:Fc.00g094150.m01.CDS01 [Cosmosporella sp. VM-42]